MERNKTTLLSVDPGSINSGIAILVDGKIEAGLNVNNAQVVDLIKEQSRKCGKLLIVIEDMRPYNMRITDEVISTIKYIGQLQWRLDELGMKYTLIPRWQVKQWVFLQFRTMAEPEIQKKIDYALKRAELKGVKPISARKRTPSFVYVDDRIVQKAMRIRWGIKKPTKVGDKAPFGLKDHSWQALALASLYIASYKPIGF